MEAITWFKPILSAGGQPATIRLTEEGVLRITAAVRRLLCPDAVATCWVRVGLTAEQVLVLEGCDERDPYARRVGKSDNVVRGGPIVQLFEAGFNAGRYHVEAGEGRVSVRRSGEQTR